jgi:hypothetical protein
MTELYIQSIKCEGDGRKNWTEPVLNKKVIFGTDCHFLAAWIAHIFAFERDAEQQSQCRRHDGISPGIMEPESVAPSYQGTFSCIADPLSEG